MRGTHLHVVRNLGFNVAALPGELVLKDSPLCEGSLASSHYPLVALAL
jgi:hypothetical protein